MKNILCVSLALVMLAGLLLSGCAPAYDKSPDKFEDVKWVTPDYSFRFNPSDDCKGNYTFNETKYTVQVKFDGSRFTVTDTGANKELFNGDWLYEDGDKLYVYNIAYNTADYEEFKTNYSEFYRLNQEKLQ